MHPDEADGTGEHLCRLPFQHVSAAGMLSDADLWRTGGGAYFLTGRLLVRDGLAWVPRTGVVPLDDADAHEVLRISGRTDLLPGPPAGPHRAKMNLRLPMRLKERAAEQARLDDVSLNEFVVRAVEGALLARRGGGT